VTSFDYPRKERDVNIAEAAEAYREGSSVRELSVATGVPDSTLKRKLRAVGVVLRGRGGQIGHKNIPLLEMDHDDIRRMAKEGMSAREIAAALQVDVSEECVRERMVRLGIPRLEAKARMEKNHFWNGGRTQDRDGYVLVKSPDHPNKTAAGYVREHRLVMETVLGRYLTREEVVDHIDGCTSNNAPENLRLFPNNRAHLAATLKGKCPNWTPEGHPKSRSCSKPSTPLE